MDIKRIISGLLGNNDDDVSVIDQLYQAKGLKLSKLGKIAYKLIQAGQIQHELLNSAYNEIRNVDGLITQTSALFAEVETEQDFILEIPEEAVLPQPEPIAPAVPKRRGRKPKNADEAEPVEKPRRGRKPSAKKDIISADSEPKKRGRKKAVSAETPAVEPKPRRGRKAKKEVGN